MCSLKLDKREINSDTVGKMPTVFLLGKNMIYIRAAPSGVIFCCKIRFETERKVKKS